MQAQVNSMLTKLQIRLPDLMVWGGALRMVCRVMNAAASLCTWNGSTFASLYSARTAYRTPTGWRRKAPASAVERRY
jgi:hypothetical protein